jgi:hypothetical protein
MRNELHSVYVPLGLVVHCLIFLLLLKRSQEYQPNTMSLVNET